MVEKRNKHWFWTRFDRFGGDGDKLNNFQDFQDFIIVNDVDEIWLIGNTFDQISRFHFHFIFKNPFRNSQFMGVFTYLILNIGGNGHIPLSYMRT